MPVFEHGREGELLRIDVLEDRVKNFFGSLYGQNSSDGGWQGIKASCKVTEQLEAIVVMAKPVKQARKGKVFHDLPRSIPGIKFVAGKIRSPHRAIQVHFLYSLENTEAEKWILETNHKLRSTYGSEKLPGFKVLVATDGGFYTEDVQTTDFRAIEINELYNDDFLAVDSVISESLTKSEAGIILLHGDPGTGKTTYLKHLISKFQNKEFVFIQNDFVKDLLKPSFISFLLNNKNVILIIEDAEKVVTTRENASDDSVVSTILQLTDGLFSDFLNIKIICTFNTTIDRLDKALLRKGRMIAKYRFAPLTPEKAAALARKLGHEDVTGSLTLADIFGLDKPGFNHATQKSIGFFQK